MTNITVILEGFILLENWIQKLLIKIREFLLNHNNPLLFGVEMLVLLIKQKMRDNWYVFKIIITFI